MAFDFSTLITDRSQGDLDALRDLLNTPISDWTAEQLAEFNQAVSRGAYNYTDLNRVTACMDYLNERLTALGYVTGYHPIIVHPEPPEPVGPLPVGYTELDYIETTGDAYLDTGVVPGASNFSVQMDVQSLATASTESWFMTINSSKSGGGRGPFLQVGTWSSLFCIHLSNVTVNGKDPASTERKVLEFSVDQSTAQLFVDSVYSISNSAFYTGGYRSYSITFFSCPLRSYGFSISVDGVAVRNFIPCKNPSGVVGMYDTVNGQFYGSATSTAFTAGPVVSTPEPEPEPELLDPYTWYESDIPTYPQMQRYITNGKVLRETLALPENTAAMPEDMVGLTQAEANSIEQILDVVNDYLLALQKILIRSGMTWAFSGTNFYFAN